MSELQGVNQCLYAARPFYRVRRERLRAGRFDPKVDAALAQCAVNHAFANRQGQHPPHALIDILLTGVHSTITY